MKLQDQQSLSRHVSGDCCHQRPGTQSRHHTFIITSSHDFSGDSLASPDMAHHFFKDKLIQSKLIVFRFHNMF